MYINVLTQEYPLTEMDIRRANPNTSFPIPFRPTSDYAYVMPSPMPEHDTATHRLLEVAPQQVNGEWVQQWQVVPLTQEELDAIANQPAFAPYVPHEVTMRQARLALLDAGLLSAVDAAIDALPSQLREQAIIEWEYSSTVRRNSQLITALAPSLNLTEQQIDDLFITAAQK